LARRNRAGLARAARGRRFRIDAPTSEACASMRQVAIVLDVRYPNLLSKNIIQETSASPDGAPAPEFLAPAA
jgi:hypothetical protein